MVDKIQKVSNPLTIIAIFAGLAEVAATVALGLIDPSTQLIFIWFVMLFPVLLIVSFFFVLWFKPEHLYAPSDYTDENNFMKNVAKLQVEKYVDAAMHKLNEASIQPEIKKELLLDLNNAKQAAESMDKFNKKHVMEYVSNNKSVLQILKLLDSNSGLSIKGIAEMLGLDFQLTSRYLGNMENLLLISRKILGVKSTFSISMSGKFILDSIKDEEEMVS